MQALSTRFGQYFEVEVQERFLSWILVSILPLMFCRGYEVESWSRLEILKLGFVNIYGDIYYRDQFKILDMNTLLIF